MPRGDIYELPASRSGRGHEQRGRRYGVVLQAESLMTLATWVVAPTSARVRPASFRPQIEVNGRSTRVLAEQMGPVSPERLVKRVGHLSFAELRAVEDAARAVLDL